MPAAGLRRWGRPGSPRLPWPSRGRAGRRRRRARPLRSALPPPFRGAAGGGAAVPGAASPGSGLPARHGAAPGRGRGALSLVHAKVKAEGPRGRPASRPCALPAAGAALPRVSLQRGVL